MIGAVFRYAIVTLRATHDPTAPLRGALLRPIVEHYPAITDERGVCRVFVSGVQLHVVGQQSLGDGKFFRPGRARQRQPHRMPNLPLWGDPGFKLNATWPSMKSTFCPRPCGETGPSVFTVWLGRSAAIGIWATKSHLRCGPTSDPAASRWPRE